MTKPKLNIISFHQFPPMGDVPVPGGDVIGPAIGENVSRRVDDVATTYHVAQLDEVIIDVELLNLKVANHEEYGQITITYDLHSSIDETIDIGVYLGRVLVTSDTYIEVVKVADATEFIETMACAYGDIGTAVATGYGKQIIMDVRYCLGYSPPYDEIIIVQKLSGKNKLIGYVVYELTLEHMTEQELFEV